MQHNVLTDSSNKQESAPCQITEHGPVAEKLVPETQSKSEGENVEKPKKEYFRWYYTFSLRFVENYNLVDWKLARIFTKASLLFKTLI